MKVLRRLCWIYVFCLALGCTKPSTSSLQTTPSALSTPGSVLSETVDPYASARQALVTQNIAGSGIQDKRVLGAMQKVPRHLFVPAEFSGQAYEDHPLPIGFGQTISQPYVVAWMTELLGLVSGDKVLEIGTGSGYQAAILAELGGVEVYSIEIVPELADRAAQTLSNLGYLNIHLRQGDGYYGWSEYGPFDAIIVTAAPDHLPAPLVAQLAENGRIVIPIGPTGSVQTLWKFVKQDGEIRAYNQGDVIFVPFIGEGIKSTPSATQPLP